MSNSTSPPTVELPNEFQNEVYNALEMAAIEMATNVAPKLMDIFQAEMNRQIRLAISNFSSSISNTAQPNGATLNGTTSATSVELPLPPPPPQTTNQDHQQQNQSDSQTTTPIKAECPDYIHESDDDDDQLWLDSDDDVVKMEVDEALHVLGLDTDEGTGNSNPNEQPSTSSLEVSETSVENNLAGSKRKRAQDAEESEDNEGEDKTPKKVKESTSTASATSPAVQPKTSTPKSASAAASSSGSSSTPVVTVAPTSSAASTTNSPSTSRANVPIKRENPNESDEVHITENDERSTDDDELDCNYDRWFSHIFPDIKTLTVRCHLTNCQKLCQTKAEHEKHLLTDHKVQPFFCMANACDKSFANKTEWKKHILADHSKDGKGWKCGFCDSKFTSPLGQFRHYVLCHEKGVFDCGICGFSGFSRITVNLHLKKMHPKENREITLYHSPELLQHHADIMRVNSITCLNCPTKFTSFTKLAAHLKKDHDFKSFPCYVEGCKVSFTTQKRLIIHMKNTHKTQRCYSCNQTVYSMYLNNLKSHTTFFHQKGQFQCTVCKGKPFPTRFDFQQHCVHKHPNAQSIQSYKKYGCPLGGCNFRCNNQKQIIFHLKKNHELSEFKCYYTNCRQNFDSFQQLDYHVNTTHQHVIAWNCTMCNQKGFPAHEELCNHVNSVHLQNLFQLNHKRNKYAKPIQQPRDYGYQGPYNVNPHPSDFQNQYLNQLPHIPYPPPAPHNYYAINQPHNYHPQ